MLEKFFIDKPLFEIIKDGEVYCSYPETQFNTPIPRIGETIDLEFTKHIVKNIAYRFKNKKLEKISIII